jgi:ATP-binding protein involved in chromosome partitioning
LRKPDCGINRYADWREWLYLRFESGPTIRRCALSVTKQQILDGLAKVASPRGVPLTNANVLSEIAVNDGKVFFSINVDAAEARAWEGVRAQAEAAVRAIPGVATAMIALTAERKPGAAAPLPPSLRWHPARAE